MACAAPLRAYKAASGRLVFFKSTDWQYHVEPYTGLQVPCGHCILCRQEQARQTAVRITHEAQLNIENAFVTLTYDDAHIPPYGSLNYPDLVKFWKRLRKHVGELRYYAVGEYGDKTLRPHYHACIFGHAFIENRIVVKQTPYLLWESPTLTQIWGLGRVTVGALTFQTAQYTASYVTKKLRSKQRYMRATDDGELVPVTQPRAFMSRNIGKDWWIRWGHQLKDHDQVVINGSPQKPPKAYDRWLKETDEPKLLQIKENRIQKVKATTSDENRARARNAHAHAQRKTKSV